MYCPNVFVQELDPINPEGVCVGERILLPFFWEPPPTSQEIVDSSARQAAHLEDAQPGFAFYSQASEAGLSNPRKERGTIGVLKHIP